MRNNAYICTLKKAQMPQGKHDVNDRWQCQVIGAVEVRAMKP